MNERNFLELQRLNSDLLTCRSCYLKRNGLVKPIFNSNSKYAMMFKSPSSEEGGCNDPLFNKILNDNGFQLSDFMVINSVQCKCLNKGKPINPAELHRRVCYDWVEQYITVMKPEKMISFGNIPMHTLTGKFDGITEENAKVHRVKIGGHVTKLVTSICPSSMVYGDKYIQMINDSIKSFKNV